MSTPTPAPPAPALPAQFLTVDDVAQSLRFQPRTIRRLTVAGKLRGSKVGGEWRYDPDDVAQFLRETQSRDRKRRQRSKERHRAARVATVTTPRTRSGGVSHTPPPD